MKTKLTQIIAVIIAVTTISLQQANAQWKANGANIFNTNTGNVGVGTKTPATKLEVKTADNSWGIMHSSGTVSAGLYTGSGGGWLGTKTVSPLYFCTGLNNTNFRAQMTILPNGNIGIANLNPQTKLEVVTADNSWGIVHTNGSVNVGLYTGSFGGWLGTRSNSPLYFCTSLGIANNHAQMTILTNGNVGIATLNPQYKLSVNGTIQAKEIRVETGWADYVFEKNYKLLPLENVADYIGKNKHLPGINSAEDIQQNGLAVAEMQSKMMAKIEELTLYVIDLQQQIKELKNKQH